MRRFIPDWTFLTDQPSECSALLKPLETILRWCIGVWGGLSLVHPWCREASTPRGFVRLIICKNSSIRPGLHRPGTSKLNSKTVLVLPSLYPSPIFPFHLSPSPVHPTEFSFCFFPAFLAIFILSSNNNNVCSREEICSTYNDTFNLILAILVYWQFSKLWQGKLCCFYQTPPAGRSPFTRTAMVSLNVCSFFVQKLFQYVEIDKGQEGS